MAKKEKPLIIKIIFLISEAFKGSSKTYFVPFKSSVAGHKPAGGFDSHTLPPIIFNESATNKGYGSGLPPTEPLCSASSPLQIKKEFQCLFYLFGENLTGKEISNDFLIDLPECGIRVNG